MKCLACGSTSLVSGTVNDYAGGGSTVFRIDEVPSWKSMFGIGTRKIRAHGCVHCGHLQLAVEFTEADKHHYQEFEGKQPDVIERINSDPESSSSG